MMLSLFRWGHWSWAKVESKMVPRGDWRQSLRNCTCHLSRHHMSLILTSSLWLRPRVWWCQNWTMMRGCLGMWSRLDVFLLGDQTFFHSILPRNYETYRCRILICDHCFGGWMLRVIPHKLKYICRVLLPDKCGVIEFSWSLLMECYFMFGRRHPTHVICLLSRRSWRRKCWWCIMTPWSEGIWDEIRQWRGCGKRCIGMGCRQMLKSTWQHVMLVVITSDRKWTQRLRCSHIRLDTLIIGCIWMCWVHFVRLPEDISMSWWWLTSSPDFLRWFHWRRQRQMWWRELSLKDMWYGLGSPSSCTRIKEETSRVKCSKCSAAWWKNQRLAQQHTDRVLTAKLSTTISWWQVFFCVSWVPNIVSGIPIYVPL